MAYTYKYTPASLSIRPRRGESPKNTYTELFEETLRDQFYNSSNWWTIGEETEIGSEIYSNVDVRIAHLINAETGLKLGDDWKTLLFPEVTHAVELGKRYSFDNNIWLTINIEVIKNLSATCAIRRCNNSLRWIQEETGIYYTEPCCIEYEVKEPRNYYTQGSPFTTPGGFLHIQTQLNENTNKIKQNQRFLFGNSGHWTCYKVVGTGINDFKNTQTYDNNSAKVLTLDLVADFVNDELDDTTNGIADVYTSLYNISILPWYISGSPTGNIQLNTNITYNQNIVSNRNILWASSNTSIATVSGSGLIRFISNGSCIITASIENNPSSGSCLVVVNSTPTLNIETKISPNTNYVLEGDEETYSVYLYINGIQQPDSFVVTCNGSNVPSANYEFVQLTGNTFKITNVLRDSSSYLTVTCTSGSYSPKENIVYLRGMWLNDNI